MWPVLRKEARASSVGNPKHALTPRQFTLRIKVFTRSFVVVPAEKREEFIRIIDGLIKRLQAMINSNRVNTQLRLKAMKVLNELISTSYTMVRDVEIEGLERETAGLEEEAKRPQTGAEGAAVQK